jgi:sec-independent protein translocase protein TatC
MLLTPPDVISQSLLAIPIWLLFELGLLMSRLFLKEKPEESVIMQTDEFALIEESEYFHEGDEPESQQGKTSSVMPADSVAGDVDEEDRELSDEEMEKLFDKIEQEEEDNKRETDDKKDSGSASDDSRDLNPPEKKQ